ncbi:MAG: histidine kinase [Bacteroidetes bacterium 4572_77]|nr:MAG: histidine kinase [Bacteroidetes bacterium 4572_77]
MDNKKTTQQLLDLKEENDYLNQQLSKLNKKLQDSDAFKSHFISNITNEIVNPFSSILGLSQSILKLDKEKIGQIHSMTKLIFNEAFDLDFQLQNIFAAAKVESGEINVELSSINPVLFLKEIIEDLRFKSEKKLQYMNFSYEKDIPSNLVIDQEKLSLIIKNILSNAIIYGHEKSEITIEMRCTNKELDISIKNKGSLLNNEEIEEIFDRFLKLDKSINSINQGHGLGLSISKAYIELLNGKIKVNSSKTEGNCFRITVPPYPSQANLLIHDDDLFSEESEIF